MRKLKLLLISSPVVWSRRLDSGQPERALRGAHYTRQKPWIKKMAVLESSHYNIVNEIKEEFQ